MNDVDKLKSTFPELKKNSKFEEEAEEASSSINKTFLIGAITFVAGVTLAIFTGGEDD